MKVQLTIEAEHCYEFGCPYLKEKTIYPPDSFEIPYDVAECVHEDAPEWSPLGASDDMENYCTIPEWCPRIVR